ncbi:dimethylhistidine N-methyltransferase [Exiguobacterium sp. Leaf187]|uniref:Dimethylhistidine N-methyltransferase n=1 Tax=Exiguobacterium indicum TaxID=296995 RepID=A0A0V8GKN3_9BACL|nr:MULTISPECIES: L-histidine N(alpha)-methyltransferase [Exiguobacterium]KQS19099.1 dimethylhistidine N-methyltransferase [Exiguobacterium sp. Leaf187]KSU50827.1 dimethylhistidine N-methyltransferase [Exiguobacterium enclense]NTY09730.1 L-histidine N(alpha)-methyltransferase [Exiguobacterium sp. JMULE1]SDC10518.1 dimethylhistidine N-methyltransferase [Exiguobacterium enclense]
MRETVIGYDLYTPQQNMRLEVIEGLMREQKVLPAKYFYDHIGSQLFEQITQQPEYYPTRTELAILEQHRAEIARSIGDVHTLIEYGSGSSRKIQMLLETFTHLDTYMPIDISKDFLMESARQLSERYPALHIKAVCGDYSQSISLPVEESQKRVIFFPGSTIGNFEPEEAMRFLRHSSRILETGDGFLIGVDLKKSVDVLERAYNDAAGVTAAFNLNMLTHLNQMLEGTFDVTRFEHHAFYNEEKGRIEMHLRSQLDQLVQVGDVTVPFKQGETIHTENSYKYSKEEFETLARQSGFHSVNCWIDDDERFSVHYLEKM